MKKLATKLLKNLNLVLILVCSVGCVTTTALLDEIIKNYGHSQHGWHRADGAILQNPVAPSNSSLENGKELYLSYCAPCHGNNGKGNGAKAKDLEPKPADLTKVTNENVDYHIYLQISLGRDGMPIWKRELSENDRWDIVNYLNTLAEGGL